MTEKKQKKQKQKIVTIDKWAKMPLPSGAYLFTARWTDVDEPEVKRVLAVQLNEDDDLRIFGWIVRMHDGKYGFGGHHHWGSKVSVFLSPETLTLIAGLIDAFNHGEEPDKDAIDAA